MMNFLRKYALLPALLLLLSPSIQPPVEAFEGDRGQPWDAAGEERSTGGPGDWLVSLYSKHISPVDGDRCPSLPSCSSYSIQAIQKHGFVLGWMMTVDRLIREGKEETALSPTVFYRGKWQILDPVENNDFWWHPEERQAHE